MSNQVAREALEAAQRSMHAELGLPLPDPGDHAGTDMENALEYLRSNPDYTERERVRHAREMAEHRQAAIDRPDIAAYSRSADILMERVDEVKEACLRLDPEWTLSSICFGTIPGGGLDAYTMRAAGAEQFGVVIPEGLFSLANLFTRLVVLLQPLETTARRVVYPPFAEVRQWHLSRNPYTVFRVRDLLRAYFLNGDPYTALPYRQALPYQDRFAYLMVGTELYVLAHEVAHVLLNHLPEQADTVTPDQEAQADALALHIVAACFEPDDRYAAARASLCGLLFHSLNALWEKVIRQTLGESHSASGPSEHPPSAERYGQFVAELPNLGEAETPPWYPFVYNSIRITTDILTDMFLPDLTDEIAGRGGISARVAPPALAHLCRHGHVRKEQQWWESIARLVTSAEREEQLLGLWFLLDHEPDSLIALYDGLLDDDEEWQELCRAALIAIAPEYEYYLPRLLERFRETAQDDDLLEYQLNISAFVLVMARMRLGDRRREMGPWNPDFFLPDNELTHPAVKPARWFDPRRWLRR